MRKKKNGAPAPKFPWEYLLGIVVVIGLGLITSMAIGNHAMKSRLDALAALLPKKSTNECATWNGGWTVVEGTTTFIGFDVLPNTIPGCNQVINIAEVLIGEDLSEDAKSAMLRKIPKNLATWDLAVTKGFLFPVTSPRELAVLIDGLAFLSMSEADQRAMGVTYLGGIIVWDLSDPTCDHLDAIHQMSLRDQILPGGIQNIITNACPARGQ